MKKQGKTAKRQQPTEPHVQFRISLHERVESSKVIAELTRLYPMTTLEVYHSRPDEGDILGGAASRESFERLAGARLEYKNGEWATLEHIRPAHQFKPGFEPPPEFRGRIHNISIVRPARPA